METIELTYEILEERVAPGSVLMLTTYLGDGVGEHGALDISGARGDAVDTATRHIPIGPGLIAGDFEVIESY